MKLRPIADEILKRSARNGFLFASFSFCIISIILIIYSYDIYFGRTQKLVKGYIPEISSALVIGDVLFVKKMLSSIEKSLYFSTLFIEDALENKIIIYNGIKIPIEKKKELINNYSYVINNGELYFLTKLHMHGKDFSHNMNLNFVQKINYIFILIITLLMFSLWFFMFLFVKNQSKKNYEKMFVPIMRLSENLKEISSSKEEYDKFVTYLELDLIYKNFNNVYIELNKAQEQLKQLDMMRAISTTIQMLAHDLRHPFAHIKNALHVMLRLSNYDEIRQYIKDTGRAIEKDILRVENMLSDLLHFRTEGSPNFVDTSFYKLIYSVIKNCFEVQNKTNILLSYDFNHKYFLCVDIQKMERVLSNIITNAIESMNGKGTIKFLTREFYENNILHIEICIANTNSYIDEEFKDKIFDLFFTKGKKRGTGIGLGIAKEIINQHGGRIFYTSSINEGVKFYIQLPQSISMIEDKISGLVFPNEAKYFENHFDTHYNASLVEYEKKSDLIENKILSFFAGKKIQKKYQILILEDDDVYVKNFSSLISSEDLNEYFNIVSYSDYDLALKAYYEIKPEYIICDIDLGLEKLNGFDFVQDLRSNGCVSKICIHTNRFFKCDLEKSINVKSDFFIAKPMSRFQFLRFLCSYILPGYSEESFLSITSNNFQEDKIILLIDDEDIYHKFWEVSVTDAKVISFSHPDFAYEYILEKPENLKAIECVIVDYYFDNSAQNISQMNFIDKMRSLNYKKPIFVSTNAILLNNELEDFDGVIKKEPYSLSKLKETYSNKF